MAEPGNPVVLAQTTVDDESTAYELGRAAVEARLAAGVDVEARMTSFYWWQGKVRHEREYRLTFKTVQDRVGALEAWVHGRHPYEVPQWIVLPVSEAAEAYLAWAQAETRGA
ncbi:divalent-cation tolerance protein CutA [Streptomyces globosus]|jgi:periplasmic divalent cation tolerance protein|uniref:divalent-cation tolerance protein CutA n=1 Tax=Streptomyces TaxID=1883 RepID=UPI000F73E129|nr:divalent-cation tolerance protein CutA [Streptomyces sp. WAC05292]RSS96338.1 divalent-cation tolerance protein CutA [Streptomyces sp. WAC05292]